MRKALLGVALLVSIAACKKTGENEYQVKTPDVNVSTDTHTVRTPDVDVGTKTDTISTPVVGTTEGHRRDRQAGRRHQADGGEDADGEGDEAVRLAREARCARLVG